MLCARDGLETSHPCIPLCLRGLARVDVEYAAGLGVMRSGLELVFARTDYLFLYPGVDQSHAVVVWNGTAGRRWSCELSGGPSQD